MTPLILVRQIALFAAANWIFIEATNAAPSRICENKEQAIEVANDILSYVYPDFHPKSQGWKPIVELQDLKTWKYWKVEYLPSSKTIQGGSPKIAISKPGCHVLEIGETD
jgi:hypothetical protein